MYKKNYLFAPFEDDDEKIESFNHLKNYLPKGHRRELIMFMGSLESYYDAMFQIIKEENITYINDNTTLIKENDELKAENERLKKGFGHGVLVELEQVDSLKEEVEELKAENDKLKHELKHKEYQAEAEEWFEHNPQDEKLFFFMVGGSGVDEDGDVINTLNVGVDCIAECDNYKGVISVETYK